MKHTNSSHVSDENSDYFQYKNVTSKIDIDPKILSKGFGYRTIYYSKMKIHLFSQDSENTMTRKLRVFTTDIRYPVSVSW